MKKKLMIVVEDTGGSNFNLYLAGDTGRLGKTNEKDLSAAEFWGHKLFSICVDAAHQAGAVKSAINMKDIETSQKH